MIDVCTSLDQSVFPSHWCADYPKTHGFRAGGISRSSSPFSARLRVLALSGSVAQTSFCAPTIPPATQATKFRPSMESQTNVVYKIPYTNCPWCYIGEAGRAFHTRKKEHLRNTKTAGKGSRIANHAWSNNHAIDFENALIIDKGTFRTRKTLEAWHTKVTPNADKSSCPLPKQYNILFNKHS